MEKNKYWAQWHLQFADDSILFCEDDDDDSIAQIKYILSCFQIVQALELISQSPVYMEWEWECPSGDLPFKHLVMIIGHSPRVSRTRESVVQKFKLKLWMWKRNNLSIGGRMILIKIALFGIPLYYMSLFKAPKKMINKLENMRRNFLCGVIRKTELFLHSGMEDGMFRLEKK